MNPSMRIISKNQATKPAKKISCCGECPICHKTVLCYCEIDGYVTSLKTPACSFITNKIYLKFKDYMEE